jgi:hypothetical protein
LLLRIFCICPQRLRVRRLVVFFRGVAAFATGRRAAEELFYARWNLFRRLVAQFDNVFLLLNREAWTPALG